MSLINSWLMMLCLAAMLGGCASNDYQRYKGDDAALLRLSQQGFATIYTGFQTVDGSGVCKNLFFVDTLYGNPDVKLDRVQTREDMIGSPPAEKMNVAELRLKPGTYAIYGIQHLFDQTKCNIYFQLELVAGEQYWVHIKNRDCSVNLTQIETDGILPKWQTKQPPKNFVCRK